MRPVTNEAFRSLSVGRMIETLFTVYSAKASGGNKLKKERNRKLSDQEETGSWWSMEGFERRKEGARLLHLPFLLRATACPLWGSETLH